VRGGQNEWHRCMIWCKYCSIDVQSRDPNARSAQKATKLDIPRRKVYVLTSEYKSTVVNYSIR
jgi:hypothetical protein